MAKKDLLTQDSQDGIMQKVAKKAIDKTPQGQVANRVLDEVNKYKKGDTEKLKNKSSPDKHSSENTSDKEGQSNDEKLLDQDSSENQSKNGADKKLGDKVDKPKDLFGRKKKDDLFNKAKKVYQTAKTVHTVGKFTMMYLMIKKMLLMMWMAIKNIIGFFAGIFAKISAIFHGIVSAVSGFLQGVVGLTAKIANGVAITIVAVTSLLVGGTAVSTYASKQNDDVARVDKIVCRVEDKNSSPASLTPIGDVSEMQRDSAEKVYSVLHEVGYDDNFIAGVLGNFQIESGIDATSVETIYSEPFQIGPRKQHAISVDFRVALIDASYAANYPAIHTVGRGLGQWTNERGDMLIQYAKKVHKDWFDPGVQLAFMMSLDTRQEYMKSRLNMKMSVENATQDFLIYWEGNQGDKLAQRTAQAKFWRAQIKDFTVQKDYADDIIKDMDVDMADFNHALALSYSRGEESDACRTDVDDELDDQLDNTGVWPEDVQGWVWSPATLPASLKKYTHDPEKYGLKYHGPTGWIEHSGQCVDFSNSYYSVLYPKQAGITYGNGTDTAERWAERFKDKTSNIPHKGSVFSCDNSYSGGAGHTGIVEHVFANGDILIIEQNTSLSGDTAGMPDTWNWRKITKAEYQGKMIDSRHTWNWRFFKPKNVISKWGKSKSKGSKNEDKIGGKAGDYGVKNASALVKEAFKHLGKPYVWGSKGPDSFDCSGLTQYVYRQVTGKDIGIWTVAQESCGREIPLNEAKQGDLYFWGPHGKSYHVALALGDGKYIEAPDVGLTVRVKDVNWNRPSFAIRPNV